MGAASPPAATRVARSGWRDPRLWIGVLLVAGSVVLGARLLAAADDTVAVWAVVDDQGAGAALGDDDVVAVRVRFADPAGLERYYRADDPLPADVVLTRGIGAGELLPRAAVGDGAETGTVEVPLDVEPQRVPRSVVAGSVVNVYVGGPGRRGEDASGLALEAVTVVDAPPAEESFAVSGTRQLVLAVEEAQVGPFLALLDGTDDAVVRVTRHP